MTMRWLVLIFAMSLAATSATGQSYVYLCDKVVTVGALGAHAPESPLAILKDVVGKAGFRVSDFELVATNDPRVKGNALAEPCGQPPRKYIFYDPAFISITPGSSDSGSNATYVLAHEAGHHIKNTFVPNMTDPEREALADEWAGWAMERLGYSVKSVMDGVDYITQGQPDREVDTEHYHSRCHRRMDALKGFDDAATDEGNPTFEACLECIPVATTSEMELYATTDFSPGTRLQPRSVQLCGRGGLSSDRPTDFARDIKGSCAVSAVKKGEVVTWYNIGLCP
jgi:hypothetical protein